MKYCVTRDEDGTLKLHLKSEKFPMLSESLGSWIGDYIYLDPDSFPDVRWGQEPINVEINVSKELSDLSVLEEQSQEIPQICEPVDPESNSESN